MEILNLADRPATHGEGAVGDEDVDGGDVTFHVGVPARYGRPGTFRFCGPGGTEVFSVDSEGVFRVRGEAVAEDRLVYEGFRAWIGTAMGDVANSESWHLGKRKEIAQLRRELAEARAEVSGQSEYRGELSREATVLYGDLKRLRAHADGLEAHVRRLAPDAEIPAVIHFVSRTQKIACADYETSDAADTTRLVRKVTCLACLRCLRRRVECGPGPFSKAMRERMVELEIAVNWLSEARTYQPGGVSHETWLKIVGHLMPNEPIEVRRGH